MPVLLILLFFPFLVGSFYLIGGLEMSASAGVGVLVAASILGVVFYALNEQIASEEPPH